MTAEDKMPERCTECGRLNVWRVYTWESKVCDECAEHMQDEQEESE